MNRKLRRTAAAAGVIALLAGGGAAVAAATGGNGGDDDATDKPITGSALDRAKAVALDHTGGGKVTGSEVGDEEGAYEVEVTRGDGSQVDVHLDSHFKVLGSDQDGASGGDDDNGGHEDSGGQED